MAERPLQQVLTYLRRVTAVPAPGGDGPLLERFARDRDQAAFAELVRRHGPMVLAACRRLLGDAHDAEDAFQATFLVFARKAGSVHKQGSVGSFLYGVARRVCGKARSQMARRRLREKQVQPFPIEARGRGWSGFPRIPVVVGSPDPTTRPTEGLLFHARAAKGDLRSDGGARSGDRAPTRCP